MEINERMKLIPYEACVGLTRTIASVIVYLIWKAQRCCNLCNAAFFIMNNK